MRSRSPRAPRNATASADEQANEDKRKYRCKINAEEGDSKKMPRMVKCVKLGKELPGLTEVPFDTPLGQKIYESVSADAWRMWAEHSKMLLNEYRLQPWKPEAQQFLIEQMEQYFFGPGSELPKEYIAPKQ
jgi:Fe-S cluster biosynthesis and repair protein YggX